MAQITIDIPEELGFMKNIPKNKWSQIAIEMLKSKINEASEIIKIAEKSKATEKDVEELTDKIKEGVWKKNKI